MFGINIHIIHMCHCNVWHKYRRKTFERIDRTKVERIDRRRERNKTDI